MPSKSIAKSNIPSACNDYTNTAMTNTTAHLCQANTVVSQSSCPWCLES